MLFLKVLLRETWTLVISFYKKNNLSLKKPYIEDGLARIFFFCFPLSTSQFIQVIFTKCFCWTFKMPFWGKICPKAQILFKLLNLIKDGQTFYIGTSKWLSPIK